MPSANKRLPLKVLSKDTQANQVKPKDSHSQVHSLLRLMSSPLTTLPIHNNVMPMPSTTITDNNTFSKVPKASKTALQHNDHTVVTVVLSQKVPLPNSPKVQPNRHSLVLQPQAKVKPVAIQPQIRLLRANKEELAKQASLNLVTLNSLKALTTHMATLTTLALITNNT
jgi:hypothetical protein